jgi:hypothetical protein
LAGVALGVLVGVLLGRWSAERAAWWFWILGVDITVTGTAIAYAGLRYGFDMAFVGGIAFIAGGLTAHKYAARRIPGMGGEV